MQGSGGVLACVTALPAAAAADGGFIITRKFIEGMARYASLWNGKVRAVMPLAAQPTNNLDNTRILPKDLPFELKVVGVNEAWEDHLGDASLALCSLGYEFTPLATSLRPRDIPLLYVTELSLRTRLQIVRSNFASPLVRMRKLAWEANQERLYRKALGMSAGVQCNGTPTFRAYQAVSPDAMLYFDSRSTTDMLAQPSELKARFAESRRLGHIRLAFSGRLVPIKGVDHLVPLANELRKRQVPFTLSIYGGGESEPAMRRAVLDHGLQDFVKFEGSVDFASELMPRMRDTTDLFVCCHRQGDPSCTYLETMSVGVPLVGYANEAFAGLLEHVDGGRATPMDDVGRLANAIANIAADRDCLERWSENALNFARAHTFEQTFARRVDHARRLGKK